MKTAYIVVFLCLLALGRAATLACEQLQKPVETKQELTGKWYVIASSYEDCWYSIASNLLADTYVINITANDQPNHYNFNATLITNKFCLTFEENVHYTNNSHLEVADDIPADILQTSCPDCLVLKNEHVKDFMLLSKRKQLNADELQEFETQVMCYGGKKTDVFEINEPTECIMVDKDYAEEMDYKDSMQFFKRIQPMDLVNCILNKLTNFWDITSWL